MSHTYEKAMLIGMKALLLCALEQSRLCKRPIFRALNYVNDTLNVAAEPHERDILDPHINSVSGITAPLR